MAKTVVKVINVFAGVYEKYDTCNADILCPYCGFFTTARGPVLSENFAIVGCHRCGGGTMIHGKYIYAGGVGAEVTDFFPKRLPTADPFVPKDIAEDYLEAQ